MERPVHYLDHALCLVEHVVRKPLDGPGTTQKIMRENGELDSAHCKVERSKEGSKQSYDVRMFSICKAPSCVRAGQRKNAEPQFRIERPATHAPEGEDTGRSIHVLCKP